MKRILLLLWAVAFFASCSNDKDENLQISSYWYTKDGESTIIFYNNNTAYLKNKKVDGIAEVSIMEMNDGQKIMFLSVGHKFMPLASFMITTIDISKLDELEVRETYLIGGDVVDEEFTRTYSRGYEL